MGEQTGDKTEEPTPHKMREARKKGQVAKSKEITVAFVVLAAFFSLRFFAQGMWHRLIGEAQFLFNSIGNIREINFDFAYIQRIGWSAILTLIFSVLPLFIVVVLVAILVEGIQTGFLVSFESAKPKLDKVNPINGIKNLFSLKKFIMILVTVAKMIVIMYTLQYVVRKHIPQIIRAIHYEVWHIMVFTARIVWEIAYRVAMVYLVIAFLDFMYQRYNFKKQMMMTKQEVKEEYKRLEGDPLIKQRQRQKQREMAQKRQMGQVPGADVVVTNPTFVAVALKYDPTTMKAPTVVAKGLRLVAEKIKEIAVDSHVPVLEREELARALYNTTEIGGSIPYELYRAVAEILAFVAHLKQQRKGLVTATNG
ncbi:flagellar biosynthesis protein FlhB [Candidatus Margulisiibacteriota bacterium]